MSSDDEMQPEQAGHAVGDAAGVERPGEDGRPAPERPGEGGPAAADQEAGAPVDSAPLRETRHSRRRFLILGGAFVAGIVGAYEVITRVGGSGGSGGGASKAVKNLFADWPALNIEDVPDRTLDQWSIKVDGLVDRPLTFDAAAWRALPRFEETVDFNCVEGWTVGNVKWGGVTPAAILDKAGVQATGKYVVFHAYTGEYVDTLPISAARDAKTVLADTLDGQALPADHGGPVRLVVPTQLGYKSVKWVTHIEVTDKPVEGYWETRGYPSYAPVKG